MVKYNWNYEELGFKSESEMNDSIARVQRKMKMTRDELAREKIKEGFARSEMPFNFAAMEGGARLEKLDRKVWDRIKHEQHLAKLQAEQEKKQKFMNAFNEHVQEESERKAQREYEEQKEKAEAELQKEVFSKHNVKTDKEKQHDEALSKMLENL